MLQVILYYKTNGSVYMFENIYLHSTYMSITTSVR
jgi:hypothetical protein